MNSSRSIHLFAKTGPLLLWCFSNPVQQKSPLTWDDLKHVYNHLPRSLSHDNLLFLIMLPVGFFGLLCLGELVQPNSSSHHSVAEISWRHDVSTRLSSPSSSLSPRLMWCLFEGDQVAIQKSTTAPDPFVVFNKYLRACDSLFPLFPQLWLRSDGSVPSWSWFLFRSHVFFPCSIGGHYMRAGGTTSLAAAGVPSSQIQVIGQWRSDTFEHYIHCHPTLLQAVLFHGQSIHNSPFAKS